MTDRRLAHFWIIADILQKRYGMPTGYESRMPWEPVTFSWSKGGESLYIEAGNQGGWEHVSFLLMKNGECILRKGATFYSEDTDVENLRCLFRKLGSADLQPMWDFLEENFKVESYDDVIKGDV